MLGYFRKSSGKCDCLNYVIQLRRKRNAWFGAGQCIAAGNGLAGDISQAPRPHYRQTWINPRGVG